MTPEAAEIRRLATDITQSSMLPHDEEAVFDTGLWQALEEAGLTLVSVPENVGGSGGELEHAAAILHATSSLAARVPLLETMWLAGWALAEAGLQIPQGPLTAAASDGALRIEQSDNGWVLQGTLHRVPWADIAQHLAVVFPNGQVALATLEKTGKTAGINLAGEPRIGLNFDNLELPTSAVAQGSSAVTIDAFEARACLARVIAMAGSAKNIVDIALRHATERTQFGRKLRDFQAIQQYLARIASDAALLDTAAEGALQQAVIGSLEPWTVFAAKTIAFEVADPIATLSHQILGAIGITAEHQLHRHTTRLRSWSLEATSGRASAEKVAQTFMTQTENSLWELVVQA